MLIFFFIVSQIQNTLISLTLTHLYRFVNEQNKHLILRITIQEFSSEYSQDILASHGNKIFFLHNFSINLLFYLNSQTFIITQ
jgi:hypothetical protein